jgi:signal transduction histidine kinase
VEGMNIHRVIQEAIHNSLKHANPTQISVDVSQKLRSLQIIIYDDGNGFDISSIDFGNGLNNMKKRAQEINAQFYLDSEPGVGTSVSVMLPE